jgi:UDP-N-acetylmuramoyl-tripeptide--D-alanyl-D-alanine ligase
VGLALQVSPERMASRLARFRNMAGRQEIFEAKGLTIINDAYNAGPESMAAALKVLGNRSGRRIAVLGDMLELGTCTADAHHDVGVLAAQYADILLAYGPNSVFMRQGALDGGMKAENALAFTDRQQLVLKLRQLSAPGDVLLFKGSRGMRMELAMVQFLED